MPTIKTFSGGNFHSGSKVIYTCPRNKLAKVITTLGTKSGGSDPAYIKANGTDWIKAPDSYNEPVFVLPGEEIEVRNFYYNLIVFEEGI